MEPGDVYYAEPYFYVNMYAVAERDAPTRALAGGGAWHTHEWIGAVLPGSRLERDRISASSATRFFASAIAACYGDSSSEASDELLLRVDVRRRDLVRPSRRT